jgi:subtilisin family serine protease
MRLVRMLAVAALLMTALTAQAGYIHPALQAKIDQTPPDQPISVIVNMVDQAPIPQLNTDLKARGANRRTRHQEVVQALQSAQHSQVSLRDDLDREMRSGGVLGYTRYWIANLMVVQAIPAEIERIAARPDVDVVEENFSYSLIRPVKGEVQDPEAEVTPPETRGIGTTPGLRAIHALEVWHQLGYNGTGALIGSLDTGVDGTHPALATRWRGYQGAHPWQQCWLDVLGTGTTSPNDGHGHGTHTTGTMTGLGAATQDTVGVAWGARWIACNAINQGVTQGFDSDIITAFQWFTDPDGNPNTVDDVPDVVQNSWGVNEGFSQTPPYTDCDSRWWTVIDNCEAASVCVTWSAGNEGSGAGTLRSPGDRATTFTNCFSVGAVDATAYQWPYPIASWSSRGPSGCNQPALQRIKPEVCAPGVSVYSSMVGGTYGNMDGTSMAGPHVAGVVALMRSANPDLDVDSIKQILMDTARDELPAGEDNTFGWGFIDAYAAVVGATVGFGDVQGFVRNGSYQNLPIPAARVRLVETGTTYVTDNNGHYAGRAAANQYTAEATATGFSTATAHITVTSGQVTLQDFSLTDIAGPVISGVTQPGTIPHSLLPFAISASIQDASTIASARLYYRANEGAWAPLPMTLTGGLYQASLPLVPAGSTVDYYVWAQDGIGLTTLDPPTAPGTFYSAMITELVYSTDGEDPGDPAWHLGMPGDAADAGIWIRDDPVGTVYNDVRMQSEDDHTPAPGVKCFVTGNGTPGGTAGEADVDHGCTTLQSPVFDLHTAEQCYVAYWRWYGEGGNSSDDEFAVDVSSDGGTNWVPLERVPDIANSWVKINVELSTLITLTDQVVFRFVACDLNAQGIVEAAIDDFSVETFAPDFTAAPEHGTAPHATGLAQNRPNPVSPKDAVTTINFRLSNPAPARLLIFDTAGRLVRTLVDGPLESGSHNVSWNGLDDQGARVSAGVYFYRLSAGAFEQSRRMTILK